jgi:hypothetical protein
MHCSGTWRSPFQITFFSQDFGIALFAQLAVNEVVKLLSGQLQLFCHFVQEVIVALFHPMTVACADACFFMIGVKPESLMVAALCMNKALFD